MAPPDLQMLGDLLGEPAVSLTRLSGGCVSEVYCVRLAGGREVVAKVDAEGRMDTEGWMLRRLAPHLPVPEVLHASPDLLLMDRVPGESRFGAAAERHAAQLLAELHAVTAPSFGLERDTLIGGLHQPNPPTTRWVDFYAEHRLLHRARAAHDAGRLPAATLRRVESLVSRLDRLLTEPEAPALLHGDVWTTNVLARGEAISGFIDPAIYFGHPEVELAFITLFGTFGRAFFAAYEALRPPEPGFYEERRPLYLLYPLLVHVHLFGGGYVGQVEAILDRYSG